MPAEMRAYFTPRSPRHIVQAAKLMGEREALGRPKPPDIKLVLNAVWQDKNRLAKARKCIASLTKLMNNEREMFNTVGVNVRHAPRHI